MPFRKSIVYFILSLLLVFSMLSIGRYIHYKPASIHQWAQSDRASVAQNYYQDDMNFFLPRVHNIANGTGITGLEFPIINYSAAVLYKIFGFDEFWYRFLELIIISLGLIYIFKLCNQYLENTFQSISIVLLFYLSPTLVYYSANFIPDLPSLGFILISWYFFIKFKDTNKNRDILLFTLFAALSSLVKITSLISVFAVLGLLLLDSLNFFNKKQFIYKTKIYLSLIFVFISVLAWYFYSYYLNEKYHSWFFLMKIRPVESYQQFIETIKFIGFFWFNDYYDKSFIILVLISLSYLIINFRRGNLLLNTLTILLFLGDICFILLMLFQFRDHDYYIITLVVPIIFLLLSVSLILKEKEVFINKLSKALVLVILLNNIIYCKNNINDRFAYNRDHNYFGNIEYYEKLKNINNELRIMGIPHNKVFTILYDSAPNNILYIINQKGYVVENTWYDVDLESYFNKSDYILVESYHVNDRPMFQNYLTNKIIEKDGISIFKLH